jgi:RNA polymerase sigma-70 factor (ECF subfamily)
VEDPELVRLAQEGDAEAYEELIFRHRDKIYSRAFSMMRNEDEALDLSQEAWIKAWKRLKQFQGEASFTTWMTRIVINLCLDQIRKNKRTQSESIDRIESDFGGIEKRLPVVDVNPTEGLERQEIREKIDKAMDELSEDHRTVIVLHQFEGLEYKEVAKKMNCSIGTVMSRLFYARRKLASILGDLKKEGLL